MLQSWLERLFLKKKCFKKFITNLIFKYLPKKKKFLHLIINIPHNASNIFQSVLTNESLTIKTLGSLKKRDKNIKNVLDNFLGFSLTTKMIFKEMTNRTIFFAKEVIQPHNFVFHQNTSSNNQIFADRAVILEFENRQRRTQKTKGIYINQITYFCQYQERYFWNCLTLSPMDCPSNRSSSSVAV